MGKAAKVKVTKAALLARLNRRLRREGEVLRACREDSRSFSTLGAYYRIDTNINGVVGTDVDPVELARELGVLRPYEEAQGF